MMPTIAVVIPNRNDSSFLRSCLDSVLNQSVRPDQVIVVDDQSTDNSVDIIRECLEDVDGAELVINPLCMGTMGALNEGLKRVTSDYVLFLSSNDFVSEGIFVRAKLCIQKAGSPGLWSAMVWSAGGGGGSLKIAPSPVVALKDTFLSPEECVRLARRLGNWFTGTTLIYNCETLRAIGGFDVAYRGLGDLLAALTISSIKGASFSPEPFGVVRQHEGGYLWRTLTDTKGLEEILDKIERAGPQLSPALFRRDFCEKTKHRFRFAAIRAGGDGWRAALLPLRTGRYRAFGVLAPLLGRHGRLRLALAYLLLRPFDVIPMIWYRWLGVGWIIAGSHKVSRAKPPGF